jgi:hypothetical protein
VLPALHRPPCRPPCRPPSPLPRSCWDYLYKSGRSCEHRNVCTTVGRTGARTAYCLGRWLQPNLWTTNKTEDPSWWVDTSTGCNAEFRNLAESLQHFD